ncbi:MAG: hypothetical protein GY757_11125, partial [bacterium]|nr:hypothetical protein [bacterium]
SFQAKLLRFIETKKYLVLGESSERCANIRIIAATNRDLHRAIEAKEFREDLYFRLHILELKIPPLRDRKEDLKKLVLEYSRFLKGKEIGTGFWEAIIRHNWPGNVRELITVLKRIGIYSRDPVTGSEIREILNQSIYKGAVDEVIDTDADSIWNEVQAGRNFWEVIWKPFLDRDFDRSTVKKLLRRAYEENSNSFKRMIAFFNLGDGDYHKFMSLMHKYKIDPRAIEE